MSASGARLAEAGCRRSVILKADHKWLFSFASPLTSLPVSRLGPGHPLEMGDAPPKVFAGPLLRLSSGRKAPPLQMPFDCNHPHGAARRRCENGTGGHEEEAKEMGYSWDEVQAIDEEVADGRT
eukprot:CAMPEP_0114533712 /NCGR_PEP_ID=MMETSP0109-20121206/27409_1 /TAXON_ID=29199 /ORGANISM="Chlorarachnion reptans, Strain CCCM449" /LENGTH=123 /DNA_ID=CAMNT_0001716989 /DNA_START=1060 /DNA_END=1428 /DNA_ORIENTATION=-